MSFDIGKIGQGIHRHIKEQDFQYGVQAERERIIKLLEIEAVRHEQLLLGAFADYLLGIIDFIKGENK